MKRMILASVCAFGLSISGSAEAGQYSFSTSGSKITFEMSSSLHDFEGKAKKFKGTLDTDSGTGKLTVDAKSLTTDLGPRDSKMHDFCLESSSNPEMVLEVTSIGGDLTGLQSGTGTGSISLKGTLTIRGYYDDVSIPTQYTWDGEELTLKGKHRMSWKTYGVPDPSIVISKLDPSMKVKFKIRMK